MISKPNELWMKSSRRSSLKPRRGYDSPAIMPCAMSLLDYAELA
jgi:hypothetical protein